MREGASIGANATIVCGVEIGAWAMIAAGAVVVKDVLAHELVMGVPATGGGGGSVSAARSWTTACAARHAEKRIGDAPKGWS